MARSDAVAADLLKAAWGSAGEKLIAVMIAIAALTSVNGSIIVGARSNYALGRDFPLLSALGRWDEESGTPRQAMLVQGAIALALVGLGAIQKSGFKGLVEYSLPVFLGLLPADRSGAVRAEGPRAGCAASFPGAGLPRAAGPVRTDLRLYALFESGVSPHACIGWSGGAGYRRCGTRAGQGKKIKDF